MSGDVRKKNGSPYLHIISAALAVLSLVAVLNIETSIKVGVDGNRRLIRMPLYVKWIQFVARHYEYARLAGEITVGSDTDEEKALAILKWTRNNLKDIPAGMPVYDDHILNIIIRGYAVPGQFQDVFTTLCAYSGIPAFYDKSDDKSSDSEYVLSFVMLNGGWRVFDAYRAVYFKNSKSGIAGLDEIIADPSILERPVGFRPALGGLSYSRYYEDLKHIEVPRTLRSYKQMPLKRIIYETRKALRIEKEEEE